MAAGREAEGMPAAVWQGFAGAWPRAGREPGGKGELQGRWLWGWGGEPGYGGQFVAGDPTVLSRDPFGVSRW